MMDKDLMKFLHERGLKSEEIQAMENEKIDREIIQVVDDAVLAKFIPKQGDRIAIKQFCQTDSRKTASDGKKQSLLNTLKKKLQFKDTQQETKTSLPPKKLHLHGNAHALKKTRKIEIGWLHFDRCYKQVKKCNGGGTRKIDMEKCATKEDILREATLRFFPDGKSKLGALDKFEAQLRDFTEEIVVGDETIGEMYENTGMNVLRFYLATKDIASSVSNITPLRDPSKRIERVSITFPDLDDQSMPTDEVPQCAPLPLPIESIVNLSNDQQNVSPASSPLCDMGEFFQSPVMWDGAFKDVSKPIDSDTSIECTVEHYRSEEISFTIPSAFRQDTFTERDHAVACTSNKDISSVAGSSVSDPQAKGSNMSMSNATSVNEICGSADLVIASHPAAAETVTMPSTGAVSSTLERNIYVKRNNLLKDMIESFKDPAIMDSKVVVTVLLPNGEKEKGEGGGVLADCITAFWEEFYDKCTLGTLEKVPCLRHDFKDLEWQAVARILLFGWKMEYLPTQLSKAFLFAACGVTQDNKTLCEAFLNFVGEDERQVLSGAIQAFDSVELDDLVDVLSTFDCKRYSMAENIANLIFEIAHKELVQAPMYILDNWKLVLEKDLNLKHQFEEIDLAYKNSIPKGRSVLKRLVFPDNMDRSETDTCKYLERYIREADCRTLKLLLRFCTGYNILTNRNMFIHVTFSSMTEFCRRPIGHTCGQTLELGKEYPSYPTFRTEMNQVLDSGIWNLDII